MQQFYHGTRAELSIGDLIEPTGLQADASAKCVFLTPNLDEAIWEAEVGEGEGPSRVYTVEPIGEVAPANRNSAGHPSMSLCSRDPLRVTGEVMQWCLYHGTRADLKPGDLLKPGHAANFGDKDRISNYVYLTCTLDAAMWGAELAAGEKPARIYLVEPTGSIEEDPNLTNKRFRGSPTKSFRSREPLRVVSEIMDWKGHSPERIKQMKDGLERLQQQGSMHIDD
jgi:rifampin ADP-ribosylating transferase